MNKQLLIILLIIFTFPLQGVEEEVPSKTVFTKFTSQKLLEIYPTLSEQEQYKAAKILAKRNELKGWDMLVCIAKTELHPAQFKAAKALYLTESTYSEETLLSYRNAGVLALEDILYLVHNTSHFLQEGKSVGPKDTLSLQIGSEEDGSSYYVSAKDQQMILKRLKTFGYWFKKNDKNIVSALQTIIAHLDYSLQFAYIKAKLYDKWVAHAKDENQLFMEHRRWYQIAQARYEERMQQKIAEDLERTEDSLLTTQKRLQEKTAELEALKNALKANGINYEALLTDQQASSSSSSS